MCFVNFKYFHLFSCACIFDFQLWHPIFIIHRYVTNNLCNLTWLLKRIGEKLPSLSEAVIIRPHMMTATTHKYMFWFFLWRELSTNSLIMASPNEKKIFLKIFYYGENTSSKVYLFPKETSSPKRIVLLFYWIIMIQVLFTFFKLYKWYQIAQRISLIANLFRTSHLYLHNQTDNRLIKMAPLIS